MNGDYGLLERWNSLPDTQRLLLAQQLAKRLPRPFRFEAVQFYKTFEARHLQHEAIFGIARLTENEPVLGPRLMAVARKLLSNAQ